MTFLNIFTSLDSILSIVINLIPFCLNVGSSLESVTTKYNQKDSLFGIIFCHLLYDNSYRNASLLNFLLNNFISYLIDFT